MTTEKVTLTLPTELMYAIRAEAPPRGLSKLVAEVLEAHIETKRKKAFEEEMKAGYLAFAEINAEMSLEWEPIEQEAWEKYVHYQEEVEDGAFTKDS